MMTLYWKKIERLGKILLVLSGLVFVGIATTYWLKGEWIEGIPFIVLVLAVGYIVWSILRSGSSRDTEDEVSKKKSIGG